MQSTHDTSALKSYRVVTFDKEFPAINNPYDYSYEFVDEVVSRLRLKNSTENILHEKRISPQQLAAFDANVADSLGIDLLDSLSLVQWIKQEAIEKAREAEELKKKEAREAEELKKAKRLQDKQEAIKQRELRKKRIYVLDPSTMEFDLITLYDSAEFASYTTTLQIAGLKKLLAFGTGNGIGKLEHEVILPGMFDELRDGAHYGYGKIEGSLSTAIAAMQSTVRKNAEFNFANELCALYSHPVIYVGSDVLLKGPSGVILGDVDSLFRAPSNRTFYLLERKTTIAEVTASLVEQLQATKAAFLANLHDGMFRSSIGLRDALFDDDAIAAITIEQGVFYEAGSDQVAEALRDQGYHVLSPNRIFRPRRMI
jgi:hypothetical protein